MNTIDNVNSYWTTWTKKTLTSTASFPPIGKKKNRIVTRSFSITVSVYSSDYETIVSSIIPAIDIDLLSQDMWELVTLDRAESLGNYVSGLRTRATIDGRRDLRIRWNCNGRLIDLTPPILLWLRIRCVVSGRGVCTSASSPITTATAGT